VLAFFSLLSLLFGGGGEERKLLAGSKFPQVVDE